MKIRDLQSKPEILLAVAIVAGLLAGTGGLSIGALLPKRPAPTPAPATPTPPYGG